MRLPISFLNSFNNDDTRTAKKLRVQEQKKMF